MKELLLNSFVTLIYKVASVGIKVLLVVLITNQELIAIQVMWNRDLEFDYTVGNIYKKIYNKDISTNNIKSLDATERRILKEVCEEDVSYYHLIDKYLVYIDL